MAFQIRTKRVAAAALHGGTSAARHVAGYDSSGSDHGATTCLSGLVQAFLESTADSDEEAVASRGGRPEHEGSGEDEDADFGILETVRQQMFPPLEKDLFRAGLAADVYKAAESLSWLKSTAPALRRATMMRLRSAGYNAGICKAKWDAAGGILAGCYEYIDVVAPAGDETREMRKGKRYIVDLDFAAEFEVARATEAYRSVVAVLPPVAVAEDEAVRRVVREVSDAARRSLRARGLHVPPWRKSRYMLAKWLGPYRRITNPVTSASLADAVARGDGEVKCRSVGFPTAPPLAVLAARTR
ncbi:uncharacterized protein LOC121991394 [Zingiber officinale]|uniref:DUF506 family protein n=1 Tax=Zingiber officinale TaxID=94328 RepID=A0A8J5FX16_ZINOF|nr:uncharacterized protein LOC121991394 [Zingiber officinale]KAG6497435.1 hypothetical protein ZIOFF_045335 [Zingiber officinale]